MVALSGKTCAHHPERAGFATCMQCRQVVCQECATTWDGINYCRRCLEKRGASTTQASGLPRIANGVAVGMALLVLLIASVRLLPWAVALMASWRA